MRWRTELVRVAAGVALTLAVGYLDYLTGIELRVFPLYFLAPGGLAWWSGWRPGVAMSLFAIVTWEVVNRWSGLSYTSVFSEYWNVIVQLGALLAFTLLLARLRALVDREHLASRSDALTGLANTRGFFEVLASELERARRYQHPLALAYLDLDGFKAVNDTHGHQVGDQVLVTVARLLREGCRATDCVARLGGDEFAILLPETEQAQAELVLGRVQARLRDEMRAGQLAVSASVGAIAVIPTTQTAKELVHRADELMYAVKTSGKDALRVVGA